MIAPRRVGVAAHPHLGEMRDQDLEADDAILDPLFGNLDRGDIAGIAQDGRGAVADFADRGDRHVPADERRIGRSELVAGQALEAPRTRRREGSKRIDLNRAVERAGSPFDTALDLKRGFRG